jgi:Histidine kinase-, DNA gyrase B-, and HSP90-like ATPase
VFFPRTAAIILDRTAAGTVSAKRNAPFGGPLRRDELSHYGSDIRQSPNLRGAPMTSSPDKRLHLSFHGRIIDSLGIQMYQSPVAAIAELIANAWDADATEVSIALPRELDERAEIVVRDNGIGMAFEECQDHYLNVGRDRRVDDGASRTPGGRPCLGRKGIGKFAGFGIADIIQVDTVSQQTGEHTVFRLDLNSLRSAKFVDPEGREVEVVTATGPDNAARIQHGTAIALRSLKLLQRRSAEALATQMARRFLLAQQSSNFKITIDGIELPEAIEPFEVQFEFPRDYRDNERPDGLTIHDGWGRETIADGKVIEWQVRFAKETIKEEDFRGVAVYCGIKVAQTPFFFNLTGGLGGQHGEQYLAGRVRANYLDELATDLITTERQRINWEDPNAALLLEWGRNRVSKLLAIWKGRRAEPRITALDEKLSSFGARLARLGASEARIVKGALGRLAAIETLTDEQFSNLANGLLTAWEGGKLKGIIDDIGRVEHMEAGVLLSLLAEEQVLSALHVAEIVRAKVGIINGLRKRILARELENDIRDYIAENPWLINPDWETFRIETSLRTFIRESLIVAGIDDNDDAWKGRMDLVLRSYDHIVVLEFMRPGKTADRDHFNRFMHYIQVLRARIEANTHLKIRRVSGIMIADHLEKKADTLQLLELLRQTDMTCEEWAALLASAESRWREFMGILVDRAPEDERLKALSDIGPPEKAEI